MTYEDTQKYLHTCERNRFIDELRYRQTAQGRFEESFRHLDHPLIPGGRLLDPSDQGAGSAAIYANADGVLPWQREWTRAYRALPPVGKRIVCALMEDWRNRPAAKIVGCGHRKIAWWKNQLKIFFSQCFQAYRRDLR